MRPALGLPVPSSRSRSVTGTVRRIKAEHRQFNKF
jgi:hypothetical protein